MTALWEPTTASAPPNGHRTLKAYEAAVDITVLDSLIDYAQSWRDNHECDHWCDYEEEEDTECIRVRDYNNAIEDAHFYQRQATVR